VLYVLAHIQRTDLLLKNIYSFEEVSKVSENNYKNERDWGCEEGFIGSGEMDRIEWEWNEFDWVSANL